MKIRERIDDFCGNYLNKDIKASDMIEGAFMVLDDTNNPERYVQAAHSLRETLYPLTSSRTNKTAKKVISKPKRKKAKDYIKNEYPNYDYTKLNDIKEDLSEVAHHCLIWDPNKAEEEMIKLLNEFFDIMDEVTTKEELISLEKPALSEPNSLHAYGKEPKEDSL